MPKRYIMKVEVEYECPANDNPAATFEKYFKPRGKVENIKIKVLDTKQYKITATTNPKARRHNEARRVLKSLLEQLSIRYKVAGGWSYNEISSFRLHLLDEHPVASKSPYVNINGPVVTLSAAGRWVDTTYNLTDPNNMPKLLRAMGCMWRFCVHKSASECMK